MRIQVVVQWRGPEAHSEAGKEADVGRRRQVREAREAVEPGEGLNYLVIQYPQLRLGMSIPHYLKVT